MTTSYRRIGEELYRIFFKPAKNNASRGNKTTSQDETTRLEGDDDEDRRTSIMSFVSEANVGDGTLRLRILSAFIILRTIKQGLLYYM